MRNKVAKGLRRAAKAAILETGAVWLESYVENEKMRCNVLGDPKRFAKYNPIMEHIEKGWYVTGPWMYNEGCGKDLYKSMKQVYKSTPTFIGKSSKDSILALARS